MVRFCFLLLVALAQLTGVALALDSSSGRGLEIATQARDRGRGFGDSQAIIKMTLLNRSMVIFDEPRDVAGTAFLSFTHRSKDDDQWLYLPALKRV